LEHAAFRFKLFRVCSSRSGADMRRRPSTDGRKRSDGALGGTSRRPAPTSVFFPVLSGSRCRPRERVRARAVRRLFALDSRGEASPRFPASPVFRLFFPDQAPGRGRPSPRLSPAGGRGRRGRDACKFSCKSACKCRQAGHRQRAVVVPTPARHGEDSTARCPCISCIFPCSFRSVSRRRRTAHSLFRVLYFQAAPAGRGTPS
jgi:hypothetical protein